MEERIAIIEGLRTPFTKSGGVLAGAGAQDLAAFVIKELVQRMEISIDQVDELVAGNGGMPPDAANVARVAALKAGLPQSLPAYTVQRNCSSGMEALTNAAAKILSGDNEIMIVVGTESMSQFPLLYNDKMKNLFFNLAKAKSMSQKLKVLSGFRPSFLKPIIGLELGLTDPACGLMMGNTAEVLARDFHLTREMQDQYALESHQKATAAIQEGRLQEEIAAIPVPPKYKHVQELDDGVRFEQTMEALAKLKPYFEKGTGTVTAGNSSQVTDGAGAFLVMRESKAKELGLKPLGYLREYAFAACDPTRMGLGPAFATSKLLDRSGLNLEDFELIELNEAFAAVVLANEIAFNSKEFANKHLGRDKPMGELKLDRLNVNGGAIALGHPIGATGVRLVLTLLKELQRRGLNRGLATLCVGGGQGAALALEVES